MKKMIGIPSVWNGSYIEECLGKWFWKKYLKVYRDLHYLVLWGIWLDAMIIYFMINKNLFFKCSHMCMVYFKVVIWR
jgi:hypothetical protein